MQENNPAPAPALTPEEQLKASIANGPEALYEYLWNTKYAPSIGEALAQEASRRADAFADDVTFKVCGEQIRLMTPKDLLYLDGTDNAFVVWQTEPMMKDVEFFLWQLNQQNNPSQPLRNAYRLGKFRNRVFRYVIANGYDACVSEIFSFMDRVFIDLPSGGELTPEEKKHVGKPPTVHSVAPLLVAVGSSLGPIDPMSGKLLGDTPIPRLIQYQRASDRRTSGKENYGNFDSMRSQCIEEMNRIMAESKKG